MNEILLDVPGFEGREFKIVDRGSFKPIEIYLDGNRVRPTKFKLLVKDNQGQDVQIKPSHGFLVDAGSIMTINGHEFIIRPQLNKFECFWAAWPIGLIFCGGAIGAMIGVLVASFNIQIFRSKLNGFLKYFLSFLLSSTGVIIWLIIAAVVSAALSGKSS